MLAADGHGIIGPVAPATVGGSPNWRADLTHMIHSSSPGWK